MTNPNIREIKPVLQLRHICKAHKTDTQSPTLQKSLNKPTLLPAFCISILHQNKTLATVKTSTPKFTTPKPTQSLKPTSPVNGIAITETKTKPLAEIKTPKRELKNPIVGFAERKNKIIQTINTENETIKIELYDNGDVDGDSVSVFYNNEVVISHKKLTNQPLTLNLPIKNDGMNELVMYADNLGTIPPNTALLIVTDGKKRYEVRITSDLEKSGAIKFVHGNKK